MNASKVIISFVGQNENGILRQLSYDLMETIKPYGFIGYVIDIAQPDWVVQFDSLLRQGVYFAWGYAGIGSRLEIDQKSLWDTIKIPFISVMADPPSAIVQNHCVQSRYVANAYMFSEWLKFQKRFIGSSQLSTLIKSVGTVPNSYRDEKLWRDRSRRMVFVKTGQNPEVRRQGWRNLPRRWRDILEDASSEALKSRTGDITDKIVATCEAYNLQTEKRQEIFFYLFQECDLYIRSVRANKFVENILDLPVDVYGRGWEHLSEKAGKARFHAPIDASLLSSIYADTQFLLNTSPNISSGIHERVAYGLGARCCVISDQNTFSEIHLKDIQTFKGFDFFDEEFRSSMHNLYYSDFDYTDLTDNGVKYIEKNLSAKEMFFNLLNIADEMRFSEKFYSD